MHGNCAQQRKKIPTVVMHILIIYMHTLLPYPCQTLSGTYAFHVA